MVHTNTHTPVYHALTKQNTGQLCDHGKPPSDNL